MVKKIVKSKKKRPNLAKEMKDAMEVFLKKRGIKTGWKYNGFQVSRTSNEI